MQTTRYPETGAYSCAAELFAALQAAAATLPPVPDWVPASRARGHVPEGAQAVRLEFHHIADGHRCMFTLCAVNSARVLEMAEQVRKHWALYGGGPKPAELTPARKPRAQWRAGAVKMWRELIEDRDHTAAADLADTLGVRYFSQGGRAAFGLVAPEPVDGLPPEMASARRCDGHWTVFDTISGNAFGTVRFKPHRTRAAAEAAALAQWADMAETRDELVKRARETVPTCGTEARAQWLREHGAAPVSHPEPETAAPAPVAASHAEPEPAPQVAGPILRDWQAAAMLASVPQVETEGEAAAMEAAALARFGVRDPLASMHLQAFPDWHRATLASLRAPEPGPAAPAAPAMPRPVPAGLADPSPWRGPENAAARPRVYSVHCRTAIAAAQAAGPALRAGVRLRRSVNEVGFPPDSATMRAQVAAFIRAERNAAKLAAAPESPHAEAARAMLGAILPPMQAADPDGAPTPGMPLDRHPPADDGHPAAVAARVAQSAMAHPEPVPAHQVPAVLAELRRAHGWSVADMAAAIGFEGANGADRVRELERKARPPTGTVRQLLAYMLADMSGPQTQNVSRIQTPDKGAVFAPKQHDGPP